MSIRRDLLAEVFDNPRLIAAFEDQAIAVEQATQQTGQAVAATDRMEAATVLTLSANGAFTNERVAKPGRGLSFSDNGQELTISTDISIPRVSGGQEVVFYITGRSTLLLPKSGTLATTAGAEELRNKTLMQPNVAELGNYTDDAAAATGGVLVGGVYRTGSALKVRVA